MRKRSGRPLGARPWETTATCTVALTSCFWQMSLNVPEDVPPPVRPRPYTLLRQPGPFMGRPTQKDRSGARAAHRL